MTEMMHAIRAETLKEHAIILAWWTERIEEHCLNPKAITILQATIELDTIATSETTYLLFRS
jgi:hypothetical protein